MRYVVAAVMVCLSLSACSGGSAEEADPPVASAPSSPQEQEGLSAGKRQALLAELRRIDPGLVADEERAVRRAESVCQDVREGKTPAQVAKNAQLRFTGGNATVDAEQAGKIVAAVKRHMC